MSKPFTPIRGGIQAITTGGQSIVIPGGANSVIIDCDGNGTTDRCFGAFNSSSVNPTSLTANMEKGFIVKSGTIQIFGIPPGATYLHLRGNASVNTYITWGEGQ